ncbi:MAG TPA: alpha/beta fold hydrolase, partial [Terrimesophilobacter sp.]|nr:alpha/beta fold hydrolase [Terrimesophilobacter sp.]
MSIPALTAVHSGSDGAPLLVLGPSLGTAAPLWDDAIELLAPHFSILSWDLPGHGLSRPATEPFTLADLADGVLRLADEHGAGERGDRRFGYAGVSLGGAVGVELALRHPDRVSALSTICSVPKFGESSAWLDRAALVRAQSTAALVVPSAGRWFGPDFIAANPRISSALLHVLSDADDESYALCCEVLAEYDARPRLGELRMPFLALSGQYDTVATPDAVA